MGPKPQSSGGAADPLRQSYPGAAVAAGPSNVFMGVVTHTSTLGRGHTRDVTDREGLGTTSTSADSYMGVDQAKASIYGWGDPQVAAFKAQAYAAGLYGNNKPPAGNIVDPATQQIWEKLVEQAAAYNLAGRKLTPNDILGMYAAGAGGQGPTTHTSTSTSVHLSDITEAKGVLDQVFQDKLGRAVTDGEAKAFLGALNAQQKAHPSRTHSTETTDGSGNSSSSSTTTDAGFDAGQYAKDYSRQRYGREIDTRTIGVDYYHAALQAIGALV
jgi:hypothetical protein